MAKIIQINNFEPEYWLNISEKIFNSGGIIAFPTDTFYGLGADPFNSSAVDRIFEIKSRDINKPIILLIGNIEQLLEVVENISEEAEILIKNFWPGPLTLIFEAKNNLPKNLLGNGNTIGVRFPNSKIVMQLLSKIKKPITATSANFSGRVECESGKEVLSQLGNKIDLILDSGLVAVRKASTIIDTSCFPPKVIRYGLIEQVKINIVLNNLLH